MALIIDPDFLVDGTEISINTTTSKITLNQAGNLSTDGVTLKAVYSKLKELWRSNATYIKHPFPMVPITDEQFELVNGWDFVDTATKQLVRTGGWALKDGAGVSQEEWAGIITLGSIDGSTAPNSGTHRIFYQLTDATTDPTNATLNGALNEPVQVFGDVTHGNFDTRSYFKVFTREEGFTYDSADLGAIGVGSMTYQVYRFPLSNGSDVKYPISDTAIDADANEIADVAPYNNMSITWLAAPVSRTIGATSYNFSILIDANVSNTGGNPTAEQIYQFVQWSLRRTNAVDIDAGTAARTGLVTRELLSFVGDTLYTLYDAVDGGVYIDDFNASDINRIFFADDTGVDRQFPYTATGNIFFNDNLVTDGNGIYRMFYKNIQTGDFDNDNAVLVQDTAPADISGTISIANIQFQYDYDSNTQAAWAPTTTYVAGDEFRNGTTWYVVDTGYTSLGTFGATDTANTTVIDGPTVVVVALGLSKGQYVKTEGTIARTTANSFSLVAPLERNYSNPA